MLKENPCLDYDCKVLKVFENVKRYFGSEELEEASIEDLEKMVYRKIRL